MKTTTMGVAFALLGAFVAGGVTGWLVARSDGPVAAGAPEQWVARIDDQYITPDAFVDEMKRRGGAQPGQFQDMEQKRLLLDELVYRTALVKAAERAGVTGQPEFRRAVDQLVSNRYLQDTLRQSQSEVAVSDEEVRRYYEAHADDYTVPARKRVAMLRIGVAANAGAQAWTEAENRMRGALAKAGKLAPDVPHFGSLAREVSDDSASRYRGGVIGWISEGRSDRYGFDRVVLEATRSLDQPGGLSDVLRGSDGVYLVRLVDSEPRQARGFDQLAAGIRQRLVQERLADSERQFRQQLMRQVGVQVRESVLASITPLAPPAANEPLQPPAMPKDQG